ncbi:MULTISPECIES: acyltransferase [Asticcacaulis]|uniref:acyltransferase family protein n=1 Tax=Asticcacaulis TaxID=76890 RepID=UPI002861131F|nr:acyltransferase [Asticcacaulis sp. BE141]MBP2160925.1 peptidoglycan/LPS O-acetylase OafA/YrhL [Asticcacaulis solisilvae]MDR6801871.1 peptidoglycan/LPS O-acetylase OafA/YrhL [Asticcacaulis sp. BE141]
MRAEAAVLPPQPQPSAGRSEEARFFELDILRGLAAILVVVFHYKHFLLSDTEVFDYAHLPFGVLLTPVYVYGQYFVELFFAISGYVFFWLYGDAVADRRLSARSFFTARFARLYPLYLAMLVAAVVLQTLHARLYGAPFIYKHNTAGDFVLSLFMVQQWLPGAEQTWNGPSWSLSVELFLYLAFFAVVFWRGNRPIVLAAIVVVGLIFKHIQAEPVSDFSRGVPSFFLGGLVFHAVRYLNHEAQAVWRQRLDTTLKWLVPVLWLLTYVRAQPLIWKPLTKTLGLYPIPAFDTLTIEGFVYGLMPLTLLALGLRRENWRHPLLSLERLRSVAWIGDISYSIYLIHFPLQVAVMLVMGQFAWADRVAIFASPLTFIAFLAAAVGLARLSFVYFEMPAREWLRRKLRPAQKVM